MEWLINLSGDVVDLNELSKSFSSPELCIVKFENGFVLKSSELNILPSRDLVENKALEFLKLINGASKVILGTRIPVTISGLTLINDDGIMTKYISASDSIRFRCFAHVSMIKADGTIEESNPADPVKKWISKGHSDPAVFQALSYVNQDFETWVGLYKIFEVINADCNNYNIRIDDWATRNMIRRFTHTANSVKAIGELARHGVDRNDPPRDPMNFYEAKAFVETLLKSWIEFKCK